MKSFSRRTKDGTVLIQTSLDEVDGFIQGVYLEYHKEIQKDFTKFRNELIKKIKSIIKKGGVSDTKWQWSYWERRRGSKDFSLKKGYGISFSNGFTYGSNSVLRYPVHPRTYINKREKKRVPKSNELALIDTGNYLKSFSARTNMLGKDMYVDFVTSDYSYFRTLENGFKHKDGGIIKRPHLAPAIELFNKSNKKEMQRIGNNLAKRLQRQFFKTGI